MGIGQGLQPVAAYNYTVKEYDRLRKGALFTLLFSTAVVAMLSIVTLIIPSQIVWAFNKDAEVISLGTPALRYAAISLFFSPIAVISSMLFQSVRKSAIASILSALRSGLAFIPTIFLLVYGMNLGFQGVALSQPVADVLTAIATMPFLIVFLIKLKNAEKEKCADQE